MDRINLLDVVKLLVETTTTHEQTGEPLTLSAGEIGTIIEVFTSDSFLVEFCDNNGVPYAMPVLHSYQLQPLSESNLVSAA